MDDCACGILHNHISVKKSHHGNNGTGARSVSATGGLLSPTIWEGEIIKDTLRSSPDAGGGKKIKISNVETDRTFTS